MPSSHTSRNRLEMQAPGENADTWGERLNDNMIRLADDALDGVVSFALSGSRVLTSSTDAVDEARKRCLNITGGSGGTVTVPNVEKLYFVRNGATGSVTITTGSGTSAVVGAGVNKWVMCDGNNAVHQESIEDFGDLDITTTGDGSFGTISTSGAATFGGYGSVASTLRVTGLSNQDGAGLETAFNGTVGYLVSVSRSGGSANYRQLVLHSSLMSCYINTNEIFRVDSAGVGFPSNIPTTASAANLVIDLSVTPNYIKRSTSSIKYKNRISDLEDPEKVLRLRPVSYHSRAAGDDPNRCHWGFIAEEAAAVAPELVHFGPDGDPEGFQYERVVVGLVAIVKALKAEVESLKAR